MSKSTKAYKDGLKDGEAWDFLGEQSRDGVPRQGWDAATINAMGSSACMKAWGVKRDADLMDAASDYNRGVFDAYTARYAAAWRKVARSGGRLIVGSAGQAIWLSDEEAEDLENQGVSF